MTYSKPEINLLGDAVQVVQFLPKPEGGSLDPRDHMLDVDPAYDLDE